MKKMETINLIRTSANIPEIIMATIYNGENSPYIIEKRFREIASENGYDDAEIEIFLDNGYFDEIDGDTVSIHWTFVD